MHYTHLNQDNTNKKDTILHLKIILQHFRKTRKCLLFVSIPNLNGDIASHPLHPENLIRAFFTCAPLKDLDKI